MPRFFILGANLSGRVAVLRGKDAEHVKVLRLKIGEKVVVCDGQGSGHICAITCIDDSGVYAELVETVPSAAEPSVRCTVLAAMPKGEKADYIVQKCTESGASEFVFFPSERCVSRPDARSMDKKITRLQRIAEEAAKQSGRGVIPSVSVVSGFAQAISVAIANELPLVMYETGERQTLREALQTASDFKSVAVMTGPEGGFERFEVDLCVSAGMKCCSMGPRILRCETAPLTALTAIMYATGNLD